MKFFSKVIPVLIIIFISLNVVNAQNQTGMVRTFKNVDGVALLGSGDVKIVHGNRNEIAIHAPADIVPYITTKVDNGTLEIGKRKKGWKKFRMFHENISYDVVVKNIDHLRVSGSGNISADKLDGMKCSVKVSGSGNINLEDVKGEKTAVAVSGSGNIEIDELQSNVLGVTISGSGDVAISGKVEELDITISGSGDFEGRNLKSDNASVDIYGSGDATFGCKDYLEALITGSGDIVCYGNPSLRSRTTGSGDVTLH